MLELPIIFEYKDRKGLSKEKCKEIFRQFKQGSYSDCWLYLLKDSKENNPRIPRYYFAFLTKQDIKNLSKWKSKNVLHNAVSLLKFEEPDKVKTLALMTPNLQYVLHNKLNDLNTTDFYEFKLEHLKVGDYVNFSFFLVHIFKIDLTKREVYIIDSSGEVRKYSEQTFLKNCTLREYAEQTTHPMPKPK